jgi:ribosomal protein S18 acetylase RimI-like enzyme
MNYQIREMTIADYDEVHRLWSRTEGLCLGEDDNQDQIKLYLDRNHGLCFVAVSAIKIIGTVLCGHDGRRGILRHLAIKPEFRRRSIAKVLVQRSLAALSAQGIKKCNIFVQDDNVLGRQFWEHMGWCHLKDDYYTLQIITKADQ